ncbi:MAG: bifunctional serine/threonine-protein kinase/formylglycine-generating enzyme family protein [Planctomycetota bacterium]|nr:bifunctional serine/threonine-protein kinase/formylglycine-generating enzyme family protein [Planctomycetota bacterium]
MTDFRQSGHEHPDSPSIYRQALENKLLSPAEAPQLFTEMLSYACAQCQLVKEVQGQVFPKVLSCPRQCGVTLKPQNPSLSHVLIDPNDSFQEAPTLLEAPKDFDVEGILGAHGGVYEEAGDSDESMEAMTASSVLPQSDSMELAPGFSDLNTSHDFQEMATILEPTSDIVEVSPHELPQDNEATIVNTAGDESTASEALAADMEATILQNTASQEVDDLDTDAPTILTPPPASTGPFLTPVNDPSGSGSSLNEGSYTDVNAATVLEGTGFSSAREAAESAATLYEDSSKYGSKGSEGATTGMSGYGADTGHGKSEFHSGSGVSQSGGGGSSLFYSQVTSAEVLVRRRIGDWEFRQLLGKGAMGAVYRAVNSRGMEAAVKVILPGVRNAEEYLPRFLQEAEVTSKLKHPAIVGFYGYAEDPIPHLALEFVPGTNLRTKLKKDRRFPLDDSVKIISTVLEALEHSHGKGIIHRDLKPENILLHDNGSIRLADYGLGRIDSKDDAPRLTLSGQVMGTPYYMSPEQVSSAKTTDSKADIYACGVMLFHFLAATPPFTGSQAQILTAHIKKNAPDARAWNPACPKELSEFIQLLMSKNPEDRPTATEALELLGAINVQAPGAESTAGSRITIMGGDTLGEWLIEGELGAGGMGKVFRARRDKADVALKVMSPSVADDIKARARFEREVRVMIDLAHKNVVEIIDSGVANFRGKDYPFMAMEYAGKDLSKIIEERGPLPPREAVAAAIGTAEALKHAHSRQVIHRDVKPENILVMGEEVNEASIRLTDFGVAALADQQSDLTRTTAAVGSPFYMAPEQAENTDDLDGRADVYSLGATLYFLLTGARMFAADNFKALLIAHATELPSPAHERLGSVPEDLSWIVDYAILKKVEDRPEHMDEFLTDLRAWHDKTLRKDRLRQIRQSVKRGRRPFENRRAWVPIVISVLALIAILGSLWVASQNRDGDPYADIRRDVAIIEATIEAMEQPNLEKASLETSRNDLGTLQRRHFGYISGKVKDEAEPIEDLIQGLKKWNASLLEKSLDLGKRELAQLETLKSEDFGAQFTAEKLKYESYQRFFASLPDDSKTAFDALSSKWLATLQSQAVQFADAELKKRLTVKEPLGDDLNDFRSRFMSLLNDPAFKGVKGASSGVLSLQKKLIMQLDCLVAGKKLMSDIGAKLQMVDDGYYETAEFAVKDAEKVREDFLIQYKNLSALEGPKESTVTGLLFLLSNKKILDKEAARKKSLGVLDRESRELVANFKAVNDKATLAIIRRQINAFTNRLAVKKNPGLLTRTRLDTSGNPLVVRLRDEAVRIEESLEKLLKRSLSNLTIRELISQIKSPLLVLKKDCNTVIREARNSNELRATVTKVTAFLDQIEAKIDSIGSAIAKLGNKIQFNFDSDFQRFKVDLKAKHFKEAFIVKHFLSLEDFNSMRASLKGKSKILISAGWIEGVARERLAEGLKEINDFRLSYSEKLSDQALLKIQERPKVKRNYVPGRQELMAQLKVVESYVNRSDVFLNHKDSRLADRDEKNPRPAISKNNWLKAQIKLLRTFHSKERMTEIKCPDEFSVGHEEGVPGFTHSLPQDVVIPTFDIDLYEVSVADYRAYLSFYKYLGKTPNAPDGWDKIGKSLAGSQPVRGVLWKDAVAFARWCGKRLPTEQEWELAARSSIKGRGPYAWGSADPTKALACFNRSGPVNVDELSSGATLSGCFHMTGNVAEWTLSDFKKYSDKQDDADYKGYEGEKVVRGGSYESESLTLKLWIRGHQPPQQSSPSIGFRCVTRP